MTIKAPDFFQSSKGFINKNKLKLIAVVCFLFILIVFILWISLDKTPPSADVSMHLQNSIEFRQYLAKGKIDNFLFAYKYYYPPFVYQLTASAYTVFGTSQHTAMLVFIPMMAIFFFSVFFIGATLFNELIGLMAAVISSTFPFMTFMYREYFLDFPCTAFTALAIAFLIKSNFFKCKRFTILFFATVG
ncbi:MAG: glycosyltransferase family 39 protein, partial [Firmicutes bacterium]|nr:glycosyltransferase family 39 protein [Bacillota bacterium]